LPLSIATKVIKTVQTNENILDLLQMAKLLASEHAAEAK
jgi:hypothetical protein